MLHIYSNRNQNHTKLYSANQRIYGNAISQNLGNITTIVPDIDYVLTFSSGQMNGWVVRLFSAGSVYSSNTDDIQVIWEKTYTSQYLEDTGYIYLGINSRRDQAGAANTLGKMNYEYVSFDLLFEEKYSEEEQKEFILRTNRESSPEPEPEPEPEEPAPAPEPEPEIEWWLSLIHI